MPLPAAERKRRREWGVCGSGKPALWSRRMRSWASALPFLSDFVRVAPAGLEILTPEHYAVRSSRLH